MQDKFGTSDETVQPVGNFMFCWPCIPV